MKDNLGAEAKELLNKNIPEIINTKNIINCYLLNRIYFEKLSNEYEICKKKLEEYKKKVQKAQ